MNLLGLMAGIGMAFNSNNFAERTHVSVVPPGWYRVQIVDSKIVPTKTPGGARLNLQFKILDGDFAGRMIFQGYNVKNNNPVAVTIAMEELAELSKAVGVPVWEDTEQLHGIPFNLKAKCKAEPGYDVRNEPQIYQHISNMEGVVYATKADVGLIPKAAPAAGGNSGGAFGAGNNAAPVNQAFGAKPQQQQAPAGANAFGQQPAAFQQQQQVQQPQQQVQQPQQQQQQQPVNFQQAAQQQPWNAQDQQQQQQQPVQQQTQQQAAGWQHQQVQPGTEQPQQQTQQQQVQEQPDAIAEAAQSTTPPWRTNVQE